MPGEESRRSMAIRGRPPRRAETDCRCHAECGRVAPVSQADLGKPCCRRERSPHTPAVGGCRAVPVETKTARRPARSNGDGPAGRSPAPHGRATWSAATSISAVGIADSIITRLAGVRQIGLRPTAAVIRYADSPADTATVAKALAVGYVLFGTIQRNADTYRITFSSCKARTAR